MVKFYGCSDDLVEIENSKYKEDEIGCYGKDVRIRFIDGTVIRVGYPKKTLPCGLSKLKIKEAQSSFLKFAKMKMLIFTAMYLKLILKSRVIRWLKRNEKILSNS